MKRFLVTLFILAVISVCGDIGKVSTASALDSVCQALPPGTADRAGCCSRHKGVCGCTGGRAKCCDGTLSPSCGCR
ncbi:MAG: hypothetical protein LBP22_08800 [Deltaproteobacteria bacterium]|nr:hypothetical protein [Deltaproteobacteria bacterium]